ncbi:hypothetical protein DMENIID0001_142760 [Sergentomyia squamirostris]
MAHKIDMDVFGQDISWTFADKILLMEKLTRLEGRGVAVEKCEETIERWIYQEKIRKLHKSVDEKREDVYKQWRTKDLRKHTILKNFHGKNRHIEQKDPEIIVKAMENEILDLKYRKNLIRKRYNKLKKNLPTLKFELKRMKCLKNKSPQLNHGARKSYVKFQDAITIFKAAKFVNSSYKKIIDLIFRDQQRSKLDLNKLKQDKQEMKALTREMEIFRKKSLQRLKFFSKEFCSKYESLKHKFEDHLKHIMAMENTLIANKQLKKIDQAVSIHPWELRDLEITRARNFQHALHALRMPAAYELFAYLSLSTQCEYAESDREVSPQCTSFADLKIRVEEVEQKIRSLQNATRCLELDAMVERFRRQLPDAEHFMVEAERLRNVRVSLIAKRKEMKLLHDRYSQESDSEFRKIGQRIYDLHQKIAAEKDRQLSACVEIEKQQKHKIQLISSARALRYLLRRHVKTAKEDDDCGSTDVVGKSLDDDEDDDHVYAVKILHEIEDHCKILVDDFDFKLTQEELDFYEFSKHDKILKQISDDVRLQKLDILRMIEKDFAATLENVEFDTADVLTRMDIKRRSSAVVAIKKTDED